MIGVIGCGAMGGSMIARLVEQAHRVQCYDTLADAQKTASDHGAAISPNLKALAQSCNVIILSLPRAQIVREVMQDLAPLILPGTIVVDTSTSEPKTSIALAKNAEQAGYCFLDAPVSGGPLGARNGNMTMIIGGDAAAIEQIRPLLDDLSAKIVHVGPSGAGHTAKIANNLLCAANLALVAEMARLAQCVSLPLDRLLEGINAGSGRSGVSEVNYPKWILSENYDSGFTMGLMRKDLSLATKLADEAELELPATRAIAAIWENSREQLADDADFNEIFKFGAAKDD